MPPAPAPLPGPVLDAHCHLDAMAVRAGRVPDEGFVTETMAEAAAVNVTAAITVGDTVASSRWCVVAANQHPSVYAAVAVHPTEVCGPDGSTPLTDADYDELEGLAADPRVVAIGETGLDYYWDRTDPAVQQEHFRRHIGLAKRVGKPLMIHDREAHSDILRILDEERPPETVVFHAFSGDVAMVHRCVDAGYVLSFPGVVTFTNAKALHAATTAAPTSHILVETDAPFLTPHPYRGRPNAPYLLAYTVLRVAALTETPLSDLCAQLGQNAARTFGVNLR